MHVDSRSRFDMSRGTHGRAADLNMACLGAAIALHGPDCCLPPLNKLMSELRPKMYADITSSH